MNRRGILAGVMTAAGGLFALGASKANAATPDKTKVVYHLTDADKVGFVLGNIKNHYEGVGGPANVTIALVVHGPALKGFHTASASPEFGQAPCRFLPCRDSAQRLRQHHEGPGGDAEGSAAGLCRGRGRRRGEDRRVAIPGLRLSAALTVRARNLISPA